MKLQVRLKPGSLLARHFEQHSGEAAAEARRLMRAGLLCGEIKAAVREVLNELEVVARSDAPREEGGENLKSVASLAAASKGWFDDEDD